VRNTFRLKGEELKLENTKLIRKQYDMYNRSNEYDIWDAYNRPSYRKERAWEACERDCENHNGYGLKVVGHNTCTFSAGFMFNDDDGRKIYCHITPYYDRYLLLEDQNV
jgi:hypothetical protein